MKQRGMFLPFILILVFSAGISYVLSRGKDNELMIISFAVLLAFGFVYQFALVGNFHLPSLIIPAIYLGGLLWALKGKR